MKLLNAAECVRKLRQAGVYRGKESYFSQLVQKGVIPYHTKEASPKKWYILDEVKEALKEWEDPTRDAQRERNAQNREASLENRVERTQKMIQQQVYQLNNIPTLTKEMFNLEELEDMSEDEFAKELDELNTVHRLLSDMATELNTNLLTSTKKDISNLIKTMENLSFITNWVMGYDDILEFYGVSVCKE